MKDNVPTEVKKDRLQRLNKKVGQYSEKAMQHYEYWPTFLFKRCKRSFFTSVGTLSFILAAGVPSLCGQYSEKAMQHYEGQVVTVLCEGTSKKDETVLAGYTQLFYLNVASDLFSLQLEHYLSF
jgi:tRNA-2-methylthio-N6-dimethylallyladenosine synthase